MRNAFDVLQGFTIFEMKTKSFLRRTDDDEMTKPQFAVRERNQIGADGRHRVAARREESRAPRTSEIRQVLAEIQQWKSSSVAK